MLSQATALDHLTTYRSAYEGVFDEGVATPRSATLHTPARRIAADMAARALIKAYRPMAIATWKRHAPSVDEGTFESFLYETVLVRGGLSYDTTGGKKKVTSWFTTILTNLLIDELRKVTQSRDLDDPYRVSTFSTISDDDDRSLFDTDGADFAYATTARDQDDLEAALPHVLDQVRDRAASRGLDADLIERVTVSYLLSRYDRVVGEEKLVSRGDIAVETGLSEWATRRATDAAEDILRRVLSNRPEDDRKTA